MKVARKASCNYVSIEADPGVLEPIDQAYLRADFSIEVEHGSIRNSRFAGSLAGRTFRLDRDGRWLRDRYAAGFAR